MKDRKRLLLTFLGVGLAVWAAFVIFGASLSRKTNVQNKQEPDSDSDFYLCGNSKPFSWGISSGDGRVGVYFYNVPTYAGIPSSFSGSVDISVSENSNDSISEVWRGILCADNYWQSDSILEAGKEYLVTAEGSIGAGGYGSHEDKLELLVTRS